MTWCLEVLNMASIKTESYGGLWLREKRKAKGWSMEFLVTRTGGLCDKAFISQVENNQYRRKDGSPMQPRAELVDAWADALGESRYEARKVFNLPVDLDPELRDAILSEFGHSLARFRTLPDWARKYFVRHANETLDLLININTDVTAKVSKPTKGSRSVDQTVNHASIAEVPEISLQDATELSKRKHGTEKKKGQSVKEKPSMKRK